MATCRQASKKLHLADFEEKFLVSGSLRRQQQKYYKNIDVFRSSLDKKKKVLNPNGIINPVSTSI